VFWQARLLCGMRMDVLSPSGGARWRDAWGQHSKILGVWRMSDHALLLAVLTIIASRFSFRFTIDWRNRPR